MDVPYYYYHYHYIIIFFFFSTVFIIFIWMERYRMVVVGVDTRGVQSNEVDKNNNNHHHHHHYYYCQYHSALPLPPPCHGTPTNLLGGMDGLLADFPADDLMLTC